jgi:hypothetical protein
MFAIILCAAIAIAILVYMLMSARPTPGTNTSVRRFPRLEVAFPVDILTDKETHPAESRNISQGGMSLCGEAPVSVAQPVQLSFILPEQEAVTIPAVVTHKQGEQIGVRFDPTHYRRAAIEKWVKATLAEAAAEKTTQT